LCTKLGWRSDLALADLLRRTGAEVDYRFKLENIDLWETVVMSNNKSMLIGGGDTRGGYSRQTEAITGGMAA
jgi:hypothetical protein